ncbi:hypothetical protein BJX62DRAFT_143295 [Aspergillus germanicus]
MKTKLLERSEAGQASLSRFKRRMDCMIRHGWIMGIPQNFLCLFVRLLLFQDCPCSRLFRSLRCQMLNIKYSSCNLTSVSAYPCRVVGLAPHHQQLEPFIGSPLVPKRGSPSVSPPQQPNLIAIFPFLGLSHSSHSVRCSARLTLLFRLCTPIIDIFFRAAQPPCILAFDLRSNDDDILVPTGPIVAPAIHNTSQAFSKLSFSVIRWPKAQPARELEPH